MNVINLNSMINYCVFAYKKQFLAAGAKIVQKNVKCLVLQKFSE